MWVTARGLSMPLDIFRIYGLERYLMVVSPLR